MPRPNPQPRYGVVHAVYVNAPVGIRHLTAHDRPTTLCGRPTDHRWVEDGETLHRRVGPVQRLPCDLRRVDCRIIRGWCVMANREVRMPSGRDLSDLTCDETVTESDGWHSHRCGNRAKGELPGGTVVCGLHLAAHNRRQAKNAQAAVDRDNRRQANEATIDTLVALGGRLGLSLAPHTIGDRERYSERVCEAQVGQLTELADRLSDLADRLVDVEGRIADAAYDAYKDGFAAGAEVAGGA